MRLYTFAILCVLSLQAFSAAKVVNVYAWGGEIPRSIIQQFEKDTGISVNFSTYDSNETMYAKLKATRSNIYDVILPSAYFVERMEKQNMLEKLQHRQLPNLRNLSQQFINNDYDKGNQYSVPLIWGATGIFYNDQHIKKPAMNWQQLWDPQWKNKLMLLDDSREVFAIALLSLGYKPNDDNPDHIKEAYQHLLKLIPNIKLFSSDNIQSIMIDEDATTGTAWNGDAYKANQENPQIGFIFPENGFVIWVDCLAIPKNPPHLEAAYQFINYMLQARSAKQIALKEGHAITNQAGINLLPEKLRNNKTVYPPQTVLQRGYFQRDVSDASLNLYNQYWQQLKLAF